MNGAGGGGVTKGILDTVVYWKGSTTKPRCPWCLPPKGEYTDWVLAFNSSSTIFNVSNVGSP